MFRQTSVYGRRNTVFFFSHKEHKDRKGLVNFVFFVAYMT